nr:hypothetical protein [Ardenticatena sp.]
MNERNANQHGWLRTGHRLVFIGLAVLLMAATAYVLGTSWLSGQVSAKLDTSPTTDVEAARPAPQHIETGSLAYLDVMQAYTPQAPVMGKVRTLDTYYARRAYDGAPPWVPHAVDDAMAYGGKDCLQCHETGGYVPPMEAYAPVAPHPDLVSCTQCHVPASEEETLFQENTFMPAPPPALGNEAYDGAPPPVPHEIVPAMRENCAACHVGPAAPPEIRTDHLERNYCLQCHVPLRTEDEWAREEVRP